MIQIVSSPFILTGSLAGCLLERRAGELVRYVMHIVVWQGVGRALAVYVSRVPISNLTHVLEYTALGKSFTTLMKRCTSRFSL